MSVPEAAVNKDYGMVLWENDVRLSFKIFAVKPKTKTHRVQKSAHDEFGSSVFRSHARHDLGALFCREYVNHISGFP